MKGDIIVFNGTSIFTSMINVFILRYINPYTDDYY